MPNGLHGTQEEPQKPQVTLLRLLAEGELCKCEREATEIVMMAEAVSEMVELPMEVVDVDEMAVPDGKPVTR